jgi:hypothetical protein
VVARKAANDKASGSKMTDSLELLFAAGQQPLIEH